MDAFNIPNVIAGKWSVGFMISNDYLRHLQAPWLPKEQSWSLGQELVLR